MWEVCRFYYFLLRFDIMQPSTQTLGVQLHKFVLSVPVCVPPPAARQRILVVSVTPCADFRLERKLSLKMGTCKNG